MGRPINKRYIGNITGSGQTIQMAAFIPGDARVTNAYIISQKTSNSYNAGNATGTSSGLVTLVDGGVALTSGQANVSVTPYGTGGVGAAGTARLGIQTAVLGSSGGSGATTGWYTPGETIRLANGTSTATANLSVSSVTAGAVISLGGNHPGYTVGDTFTWGYTGYSPATVITVASTSGNGNVNGLTITTAGTVTNVSVTNTVAYSSSVQTNAWATGQAFAIRWDASALSVVNPGSYSVAPANPVATTGSTHGTGANATVTWGVVSVTMTNNGNTYQAAAVTFSSGAAAAVGVVNAAGSVTSVSVTAPGSYSNTAPNVTIAPVGTVQYASSIKNRTVETFAGNSYEWVDDQTTMTSSNQAQLQTA